MQRLGSVESPEPRGAAATRQWWKGQLSGGPTGYREINESSWWILFVCDCYRADGDVIRIISARRADRRINLYLCDCATSKSKLRLHWGPQHEKAASLNA
jgi:hypothetical protein